ncbi:MAG: hypothetical protein WAR83_00690, partial [Flavobacteriales bacterium]
MRRPLVVLISLMSVITAMVIWWNSAIHFAPLPGSSAEQGQVDAMLASLNPRMHNGVPDRMQRLFPEGEAFSYALYGLANCNTTRWCDHDLKMQRIDEARWALNELESERVRARFPALLPPVHGIFHAGWSAFLHGSILQASGIGAISIEERQAFIRRCDTIASTVVNAPTAYPESYNGMAWPADATVAMAALALHDRILPDRYANVRRAWVQRVRRTIGDSSGVAHAWDPETNAALSEMRGSSLALMCLLLPEIDSTFANEQFTAFSDNFFDEILGVPVVNEFPKNSWGKGDIDSGPLIFGAGPVAMIVGAGACRTNGDAFHDLEMNSTVDGFGFPLGTDERRYLFGAMPVAELFIAWCRSQPVHATMERPRPRFLRFHGYSVLLLILIWLPPFIWWRRQRT